MLVLITFLVVSLVVGLLAGSAQADGDTPSTEPSAAVDSSPSADETTADESGSGSVVGGLLGEVVGPDIVADPTLVLRRGLRDSVDLAANDNCHGNGCEYTLGAIPTGWSVYLAPAGLMTVSVPGNAVPGTYRIGYSATENGPEPPTPTQGALTVAVTPDNYTPPAGMLFSHPYRKKYRYVIRRHILRTIDSTPPGETIRVASWSFSSKLYRVALKRARARGVAVQIVLAFRNKPKNSDFGRLRRIFGTTRTPTGSWVRKCRRSCRGVTGTMHAKIFLFSKVYRTPSVMISGSANLTDFAVTNQWNQMNTTTADAPVYDEAVAVFNQMSRDLPVSPQYIETQHSTLTSYYYPHNRVSARNDFMLRALAPVRCKGAVNAGRNGRTIVKIAMYAWYQSRGKWLAKRVRQLWQHGCQVQIVYAISSNPVKSILYSPSGRGRIPMRQILLTNTKGTPIYYLHDKWVAITGNYAGIPDNSVSFHGSFNFSDLGFTSDEQFQKLPGRATYNRFARDFKLLWKDRQARAPSPISKIPTIEGRYTQNDLRLGTGVYRYMDAD